MNRERSRQIKIVELASFTMETSGSIGNSPSLNEICACGKLNCGKLKYIQPSLRQSFRPSNESRKSNVPMTTDTTSKLSYQQPLEFQPSQPFKPKASSPSNVPRDDTTTYELSYIPITIPPKEQYPWTNKQLKIKPDIPMESSTTQKLSYGSVALPTKEQYPWARRQSRIESNVPMESDTIQKLSFGLPGEFVKVEECNYVQRENILD